MCVPCVSPIEIQTKRPIAMIFGISIVLNGGNVCNWDFTPYPKPRVQGVLNRVWRASAASSMKIGKTFANKSDRPFLI